MRPYCILCLSLVLSHPAAAQTSRVPLRLNAAIAEAVAHNPDLAVLRREYETARRAPAQERFLMPPTFETQIWGWPVTTLNPARTDMYMFMGEQEIPGRGKRAARALVAERDAAVSSEQIVIRANEVVGAVKETYVDLALARDTLGIYEQQVPVLNDIADAATSRYATGQVGQSDSVKAIGELTRLRQEEITWRERARMTEARLNALLGRSPLSADIEPLERDTASHMPSAGDIDEASLAHHPQLAMADAEIAREEAELARLRGDRRPDFVVGGGYMLQPGGAGSWTARAGLTWPNAPWSRGKLDAAIDIQMQRIEAAKTKREAVAVELRRGVQEALVRLDAARQRLDLLQTTVLPHAEHEFGLARVGYIASRSAFADVVESQRMLVSAEVDRVAALADIERAAADLDRATGKGTTPDLVPEASSLLEKRP
jgi:outer membrane protein TolC